jgi:peptidoglycan/LPS O-acetylase OafA/YrhL
VSFTYRPDIDGLRAVAVIPVILFHADVSNFTGGYVGVDIFFVISGYLITNVLMKDINHGKFFAS